MINQIKYSKSLKPFITNKCEENEIFVSMAKDIPGTSFLVIKVDRYYNSLKIGHLHKTPPSVDCLVLLKCRDNTFIIYLVELKKVKSPAGFSVDNIYNKFKTTIENFMGSRFNNIFLNERYIVRRLQLYFVTSAYGEKRKSWRKEGTKLDVLRSLKPFKFRGKRYQIVHKLPNPLIKNCLELFSKEILIFFNNPGPR
jgi:hypothetical protein